MQYTTHTSIRQVGGVTIKAISRISSSLLFLASIALTSCEKEITPEPYQHQLVEYHAESLNLQQAAADSIHRYQLKVADMAEVYPAVKSESLYRQIVQNIYNAYLVVGIKPGEWDDAEQISFTFGNQ